MRRHAGTRTPREGSPIGWLVIDHPERRNAIVNEVFAKPVLEAQVRAIAGSSAENAPLTLRSAKRVIGELAREEAERDRDAMRRSILACFESEDDREGVRAFLAKLEPVFRGR